MRLHVAAVIARYAAAVVLALATAVPYGLAAAPKPAANHAETPPSEPPHAWLFGVWTGGLFPVLDGMTAQDCRSQPTVVFAQDEVDHAGLIATGMTQRIIETVRASPTGAEFRLTPSDADPAGFGCDNPDDLHVARDNDNMVRFPNCAAFPYPLERCPRR